MKRRGFTLIEILIVITLIGAMLAIALPRLGDVVSAQRVRSAADAVMVMHAKARALSAQHGVLIVMEFSAPSTVRLWSWEQDFTQTQYGSEDLQARYGTSFRESFAAWFQPGGMAGGGGIVTLTNGVDTRRVEIGQFGRVRRLP
jgi:prepilin-type N-terminal cleavage/methylation domain-containing protein